MRQDKNDYASLSYATNIISSAQKFQLSIISHVTKINTLSNFKYLFIFSNTHCSCFGANFTS